MDFNSHYPEEFSHEDHRKIENEKKASTYTYPGKR